LAINVRAIDTASQSALTSAARIAAAVWKPAVQMTGMFTTCLDCSRLREVDAFDGALASRPIPQRAEDWAQDAVPEQEIVTKTKVFRSAP
jgi:hypothetical protein